MTVPDTRPSLLLRIRDSRDQQAWLDFHAIYQPLIMRLVTERGLQDGDARDVSQEVFVAVSKAIGRWDCDPNRGSFRGWLSRITRNLVVNFLIHRSRHPRAYGDSDFDRWIDEIPAPDDRESHWFDLEHRRQIFLWASSEIRMEFRETLWQAFWQTSIQGRAVAEVSEELGISAGALYVARSRIMKRLREKVEDAE